MTTPTLTELSDALRSLIVIAEAAYDQAGSPFAGDRRIERARSVLARIRYCHECGGPATQTRGGYYRHEGVEMYDSDDFCDECAAAFDRKHEKPERGI